MTQSGIFSSTSFPLAIVLGILVTLASWNVRNVEREKLPWYFNFNSFDKFYAVASYYKILVSIMEWKNGISFEFLLLWVNWNVYELNTRSSGSIPLSYYFTYVFFSITTTWLKEVSLINALMDRKHFCVVGLFVKLLDWVEHLVLELLCEFTFILFLRLFFG